MKNKTNINILKEAKLYNIMCVKVIDANSNKLVWRARGKIKITRIIPMESPLEDFNDLEEYVSFVKDNWLPDLI